MLEIVLSYTIGSIYLTIAAYYFFVLTPRISNFYFGDLGPGIVAICAAIISFWLGRKFRMIHKYDKAIWNYRIVLTAIIGSFYFVYQFILVLLTPIRN